MKFHNNHKDIIASVAAGETFKTTTYWRHSLVSAGVVLSPEWRLVYRGNYIIVQHLDNALTACK